MDMRRFVYSNFRKKKSMGTNDNVLYRVNMQQLNIQGFASSTLECGIIWEVSATDEKTGRIITAPLSKPCLASNAILSIFLECPIYLSSVTPFRETPEERQRRDGRTL